MAMSASILKGMKKRPFLIAGGLASCSLIYLARRRRSPRLPDGDIWLDMDLSRPLLKTNPGVDLSFLTGEASPLSVRDAVDALEMAAKDDRVRGVLGRFSYRSWNGGPCACVQELRDAIGQFRASAGAVSGDGKWGGEERKFTIAVADTFGEGGSAVGEYYLASAFEKILLQRSGYVGLTGIGAQQLFFRGFCDKYGIKPEVYAREEYKSFAETFTEKKFSKPNREAMTSLLTGILDDVADGIAISRGFEGREAVLAIMQDCPLPAKQALAVNLVDGILYTHDAESMVDRLLEGKPPLGLPSSAGKNTTTEAADSDRADVVTKSASPSTDGSGSKEAATAVSSATEDATKAKTPTKAASGGDPGEVVGESCTRVSMADYVKAMRAKEPKVAKLDESDKYVAVINIGGTIVRHAEARDNKAASSMLCERLQKASEDPMIGAIVLRIDSGGGSAIASDSIAAAVELVRQAGKPVVCSMGDVAASGGYMIAAACDSIVAQPMTITGSIGVISLKVSLQRLLKDWGIEVDTIELGENHLAFSPFQELTPKQRDVLDGRIGEIYEDFVSRVADGRKLSVEKVLAAAKGRIWTGRQAQEHGLVDELGGLNSAIAIAKKAADLPEEALAVTTFPVKPTLSKMFKRFRESGDFTELGDFGVRSVFLAAVEALVGAEAISSMSAAVTLLASLNDVANGRVPSGTAIEGRGELEIGEIDIY